MLIAVLAALGAAGSFAAGGVLQQRPASARPEGEALSFRLILDLAREPMWLLGIGFAFLSYALEGLALSFGPLVLVQPLIVTELLYALPISVRWRGMRMSSREWLGTLAVAGGLTLGLVFAAPGAGRAQAPIGDWVLALCAMAGATLLAVSFGRARDGPLRPSLYALGAALVFGSQAALFKATVARVEHGIAPALESWQVYAMSAAAILGLLLVQSAYESGPLAASMPVVDASIPRSPSSSASRSSTSTSGPGRGWSVSPRASRCSWAGSSCSTPRRSSTASRRSNAGNGPRRGVRTRGPFQTLRGTESCPLQERGPRLA